jgi:pimeloyl-ACP methyl ester carboxylesterase
MLAFHHADSMLNYHSEGQRTRGIERLGVVEKLSVLLRGVRLPRPTASHTPEDVGLPYSTVTIDGLNNDRLSAWHIPARHSPATIALFHGYSAEKSSLLSTASLLHESGYSCLMVDFHGSGDSSESSTTFGHREGDDVKAVMDWLHKEKPRDQVILYGCSMGAAAILCATARHEITPDGVILNTVFDNMLRTTRNRFRMMHVPSWPSAELLVFWGGVQMGFNGFANNPEDFAASLSAPALFVSGSEDTRAPADGARRVFENTKGKSIFLEIDGMGHNLLADYDEEQWKNTVLPFIEQCLKK